LPRRFAMGEGSSLFRRRLAATVHFTTVLGGRLGVGGMPGSQLD